MLELFKAVLWLTVLVHLLNFYYQSTLRPYNFRVLTGVYTRGSITDLSLNRIILSQTCKTVGKLIFFHNCIPLSTNFIGSRLPFLCTGKFLEEQELKKTELTQCPFPSSFWLLNSLLSKVSLTYLMLSNLQCNV